MNINPPAVDSTAVATAATGPDAEATQRADLADFEAASAATRARADAMLADARARAS